MFEVRKFEVEHLEPMLEQPTNQFLRGWIETGHAAALEDLRASFTGFVDGRPAVCGGVVELWQDRGHVWSVFNADFKGNFVPIFRGVMRFLDDFPCRRLEIAVPIWEEKFLDRAELWGFKVEAPLAKKYLPDGSDCAIFARVRD